MRIKRADGSGVDVRVVQTHRVQLPQDWSPDGRSILFADQSPARRPPRELWRVPVDGSPRPGTPRDDAGEPLRRPKQQKITKLRNAFA
jgi:hypothetical protein